MAGLTRFSGNELTVFSAAVAAAIAEGMDNSDVNILSGIFSAIGDNLGIIASRNEAAKNDCETAGSKDG
jgi:hypothetical protein